MLSLLISIVLIVLFYWAVNSILAAAGIGEPAATIVRVVTVILLVYVLLTHFGVMPSLR